MTRFFSILLLILLFHPGFGQEQNKSVCLIQIKNESGRVISEFTGTFLDGSGTVLSHKSNFLNAASAQVLTQDSTIHQLVKVSGEDELTGLVKFKIDNNLSSSFKSLKIANDALAENGKYDHLLLEAYNSIKSSKTGIQKIQKFSWYGIVGSASSNFQKSENGSVLLRGGQIHGVVISLSGITQNMILPSSSISNLKNSNKDFNAWKS